MNENTGAVVRTGYAGQNLTLGTVTRGVRVTTFTEARCIDRARSNLASVIEVLRWNREQCIELFRLSSGLIPLGSHPVNTADWRTRLASELADVGRLARKSGLRLSTHPGQYTRLASRRAGVREASARDLSYHAAMMDAMGLGSAHPIVVHVGGTGKDGEEVRARFADAVDGLTDRVRGRLVMENDEWGQGALDVIRLCEALARPAVLDLHHERVRRGSAFDPAPLIRLAADTWGRDDGPPKIHLSSGLAGPFDPRHAPLIDPADWAWALSAVDAAGVDRIDIMVEAKQKDRAVLDLGDHAPWRRVSPYCPVEHPSGGELY